MFRYRKSERYFLLDGSNPSVNDGKIVSVIAVEKIHALLLGHWLCLLLDELSCFPTCLFVFEFVERVLRNDLYGFVSIPRINVTIKRVTQFLWYYPRVQVGCSNENRVYMIL